MSVKITVITVTYNCASTLQATIDSVVNQTYPNIEYIIVDGASTDETLDIIKVNEDKITRWISEPDKGIYDAMNKGIDMATGDYINFMNAGDYFYSKEVVEQMFNNEESLACIMYGDTMIELGLGSYIEKAKPIDHIINNMVFGHQSVFVNSEYHKENKFDTNFKSSGDYNFFFRAYKQTVSFLYVPIIVANYNGEEGVSNTNYVRARFEDGIIQGKSTDTIWRLKFYLRMFFYKTKQTIKLIMPQKITFAIQENNYKNKGLIKQ